MNKIFLIAIICLLASCKQQEPKPPNDYAVIHGAISNSKEDISLRLYDPISSESIIIEVDKAGNFRDTLHLEKPAYFNVVYNNVFNLYLANNMDVEVNFDGENISKTLTYKGNGAAENDFLKYKFKKSSELMGEDYKEYLGLDDDAFKAKTSAFSQDLVDRLESANSELEAVFIATEKENISQFEQDIHAQHKEQLKINAALSPGMPSPAFADYVNYKGGVKSLVDFKGKYVYIDVWATWCIPCIYEMPYMKEVEEEYKGKNIEFIGISIDRKKDEDKWRKMIVEKELKGTQLLADAEIDSQFIQDYFIQGIPRFILLDPNGNIVSYDAPRPSEQKLKDLLNSLDI